MKITDVQNEFQQLFKQDKNIYKSKKKEKEKRMNDDLKTL